MSIMNKSTIASLKARIKEECQRRATSQSNGKLKFDISNFINTTKLNNINEKEIIRKEDFQDMESSFRLYTMARSPCQGIRDYRSYPNT